MITGFINLNKEAGMTSQSAVYKVKRILHDSGIEYNKIGHMGTLDPDGEGVLPIAIGRATRLFDYLIDKRKVYYTEFVFGKTSDTLDESGNITDDSGTVPSIDEISDIIPKLIGDVYQMPPAYSAKVIGGVRAYKLARSGEAFELTPKKVNIYNIEFLGATDNSGAFAFNIECGGGTYIRSIARDMASALGTIGLMRYIRRTKSGVFDISNAVTLEQIIRLGAKNVILPVEYALNAFPRFDVPENIAKKIKDGLKIEVNGLPDGFSRLYVNDELFGIAEKTDEGKLSVRTRLI